MSVALAVDSLQGVPDVTEREEFVQGVLTFSGNYATGGDTLSFAGSNKIQSRSAPNRVEIYEEPLAATQTATGSIFIFAKGTTQANGKVQIFSPSGTASGTISAPTLTIGAGTPATYPVGTAANTGTTTLVATGAVTVTGISAPTFTGAVGAASQLAAGAYGSAFATTTVKFRAWFPLGQ